MYFHLTARAYGGLQPLRTWAAAQLTWTRLRAAFPDAVAAVLLLNHLHLLVSAVRASALCQRLGAVLSGLTRSGRCGSARRIWEPVPPPSEVPDLHHLRRQIRYLALNPCRARLCTDPLSWVWSTHRDIMGAAVDPWVTPARLASVLGKPVRGFSLAHHAYVSADPSVEVAGTPPPTAAPPRDVPTAPLEEVARAAAAALRLTPDEVSTEPDAKRLFVHLATQQGWRDARLLAMRCGIQSWQVRHIRASSPVGLEAGRLCLGDERLSMLPRVSQPPTGGMGAPITARR